MKKNILKIGLLCLTGANLLFAQTPKEILDNSLSYIGSMKEYKIKGVSQNLLINTKTNTVIDKYTNEYEAFVKRPSKIRINVKGDTKYREYYFNNGKYTLYNEEYIKYWGEYPVSKNTDKALSFILEKYGERPPMSILLYSDMSKRVNPKSIKYFGEVKKNGVLCDYLAFKSKKGIRDIHVWISKGKEPLIIAYTIIRKNSKNEYRINISLDWKTNNKISEKMFLFNKKGNGKKIPIKIKRTKQY